MHVLSLYVIASVIIHSAGNGETNPKQLFLGVCCLALLVWLPVMWAIQRAGSNADDKAGRL